MVKKESTSHGTDGPATATLESVLIGATIATPSAGAVCPSSVAPPSVPFSLNQTPPWAASMNLEKR